MSSCHGFDPPNNHNLTIWSIQLHDISGLKPHFAWKLQLSKCLSNLADGDKLEWVAQTIEILHYLPHQQNNKKHRRS